VGIDTILHFRSLDSTADINARLAGLIPKGILKGAIVIPEPNTLQVRIVGDGVTPWVFLAYSSDGMLLRDTADEIVLPVLAGTDNVIVLRAQYIESGNAVGQAEVMTLGAYNSDPNPNSLIRLARVTPAVGSTAVLPTDIDMSFRDSVEGLSRNTIRGVVQTVAELPAVSGFPATGEINFIANTFANGTTVTVGAGAISATFPIVPATSFLLASPSNDLNNTGLSRVNPSQATIVSAVEAPLTGVVTVTTAAAHGYSMGNQIRITGSSAITLNGLWTISTILSATQFKFTKVGTATPATGTSGISVNTATICTVTARTAPGVIHNLVASQPIVIENAIDPSFNVASTVSAVLDGQTFTFTMSGFGTAQSGGGEVVEIGISVPTNGVQIGTTSTETAFNFAKVFQASTLASLIQATALGSSVMFQTILPGSVGNTYTLAKAEPGVLPANQSIVLSGSTFSGGADPIPGLTPLIDLQSGDLYVVLYGSSGTLELWGFDGTIFRNLTSSSFGTLLDFHRRNLFVNEKHLTENQQAALKGSVGTPGPTNLYVTQQDTSVLSADLGAALQGADNVAPSASNRFLTEARYRGQRQDVVVPTGQNWVQLPPLDERWVVGNGVDILPVAAASWAPPSTISYTNQPFAASLETAVTLSSTGSLPTGLSTGVTYYIVNTTTNSFQLSLTPKGTAVVFTDSGTALAFHTITRVVSTATQFFNVVFTDSLRDPGGPTEYTQQDFTPLTATVFYNKLPFSSSNLLNPGDPFTGADSLGIYPQTSAAALSLPINLYAQLSAVPNNGDCSLIYSRAAQEKVRQATSDMLAGPQRILPAEIADIQNKVSELRFNTGIGVSGTTVSFPANLFNSLNAQGYTLRRPIGGALARETLGFSIDLNAGTGTAGIVNSFVPVIFSGANVWTRYTLTITQEGKVNVYPLSGYAQYASDLAYGSSLSQVAIPNLAFTKGEYVFASIGVKSASTNTIQNLVASSLEIYPYQGTNARDAGAVITCGDATTSFGSFSGPDAITRAVQIAKAGDTIRVLPGTYIGQVYISEAGVTLDFCDGAELRYRTNERTLTLGDWDNTFTTWVITDNVNGFLNNQAVKLSPVSPGALPAGLSTNTTYYVQTSGVNTYTLSLTVNGSPVQYTALTGVGSVKIASYYVDTPNTDWNPLIWVTTTLTPHGLYDNLAVQLATSGSLPLGLFINKTYFIINSTPTSFQLSLTPNGVAVHYSSIGIGIHTVEAEHSGIIVDAPNVKISNASFEYCDIGVHLTNNASGFEIVNSNFDPLTVFKNFQGASSVSSTLLSKKANVATYTCTDGSSIEYVGDYNSLTAFADALAMANSGDTILLYPGTYSGVVMTGSGIHVKGFATGVFIDGQTTTAITLSGANNVFDNIICTNSLVGIKCLAGATSNVFNVSFTSSVFTNIEYPVTGGTKHFNFHPQYASGNNPQLGTVTGNSSRYVTVGDGISSWGDYVGADAINQALNAEQSGTTIRVGKGTYAALATLNPFNNMTLEGSGSDCIIQADHSLVDLQCIYLNGSNNKISGFHLNAVGNFTAGFTIAGIIVGGDNNVLEKITHTETGTSFVPRNIRFVVKSGFHNRYIPHEGAATDVVSWTVGDGIRSFGDFVGISTAFSNALNFLPALPGSANGNLIVPVGNQVTFQDVSSPAVVEFLNTSSPLYINVLYRYINIQTGANQGDWKVVAVTGATSLTLERYDGVSFTAQAGVQWSIVVGTKLIVLPGTYTPFTIGPNHNDVDIEAWGNGSDVILSGGTPLLTVQGNRCRISGFRFEGAGVAIEVTGQDNYFEKNRFANTLASRYQIDPSATGNSIKDSFENSERVAYTVSPLPSRGDFVGSNEVAIQAAVNAAAVDPQVKRVFLGAGVYTLNATVTVPPGITIFGSGYDTSVTSTLGTFPGFTLTTGNQTITGINFSNLSNSLYGPATGVYAYGNWLATAPINANVILLNLGVGPLPGASIWIVKNAAYAASDGDQILADTNSIGAFTITLPVAPTAGMSVSVMDAAGTFSTNTLTVDPGVEKIAGVASPFLFNTSDAWGRFVYFNATRGWAVSV